MPHARRPVGLLCPERGGRKEEEVVPSSRPARGRPGQEHGAGFTYPKIDIKEFQKIPLTVGEGQVAFFKKTQPLNVGGEPVVADSVPVGAKIK